MQTSALASLYTFALRKGQEKEFLSEDFKADLEGINNWPTTYEFLSLYGTHYLKKAKMGARYQENIYFSEKASEEEIQSSSNEANSNSFSASASASYGAFSGSVSGGRDSAESTETSEESTIESSESVSTGGIRQFGQIHASGKCGELLGEDNILFPVEYETEPIYKLVDPTKYPNARKYIELFLKLMTEAGT